VENVRRRGIVDNDARLHRAAKLREILAVSNWGTGLGCVPTINLP
jgi:hypothetical protein